MQIKENIQAIRQTIPGHVQLVCVSKFHPAEAILEAYKSGERVFGESKVQELCAKQESLPKDIEWHFIGHLQTNKVKQIVPFVELIHGVDSYKLLSEINKQGEKINRKINCLLQVHIAQEETKFGFDKKELLEILDEKKLDNLPNIEIRGLMGMATFTDNTKQVRCEFKTLKELFDEVKNRYFPGNALFSKLSMGMSDDYCAAIEEGSNIVRIGSSIFGERKYL